MAEDALQEAWVSTWKNAACYRSEVGGHTIQPMTWLIAIVRNKALDAYRARARRKENELPDAMDETIEHARWRPAQCFSLRPRCMTADQVARRTGEKLPQSYVGLLTDAAGNGKVLVSSLRHGKTMSIKVIGPFTPPATGRLVLWAVPANAPAMPIGIVPVTALAISVLPNTSEKPLSKVSKLVVTAKTDAAPANPSGNVFFRGNCAKLW